MGSPPPRAGSAAVGAGAVGAGLASPVLVDTRGPGARGSGVGAVTGAEPLSPFTALLQGGGLEPAPGSGPLPLGFQSPLGAPLGGAAGPSRATNEAGAGNGGGYPGVGCCGGAAAAELEELLAGLASPPQRGQQDAGGRQGCP
ncbi:hypothetical protein MNEG_13468 [Monoraphidium neglectum]|uniref:Uncharacterized protein n=1 Tax=Monoraphidium neglectum TaxID=145388 RepID=A0A0D2KF39_9CHLO|nr:hypothetical protein MNEG_13468 [Monoraphidium neglectum]KIY94493.1 hypothetical protein MNEG_13468 [Monoraphidium neglectum]|eukprot:XP_013893513.1 hypothetical protein MNEG_13468 [Monoraphidium neglectum]